MGAEEMKKSEGALLSGLERCSQVAEKIGIVLAAASGFVMLFSLLTGVATRWLPFMTSAIWSEEIARMCMLWLTTNGASVAYRRLELVRFNLLTDILPKKVQYILEIVADICILITLAILLYYGYDMLVLKSKVEAAATHISYFWWALGLYIGFILMTVHGITQFVQHLSQWNSVWKGGKA